MRFGRIGVLDMRSTLVIYFFINVILAEDLKNASFIKEIYELVKSPQNSAIFDKYSLDIFKPLTGPFYQHLSLSTDSRSRHMAENGFSEVKNHKQTKLLYPPIKKGDIISVNVSKFENLKIIKQRFNNCCINEFFIAISLINSHSDKYYRSKIFIH